MKTNSLSVFHHHVLDVAKARGVPIGKALAETRAMGFDGLVTEVALLKDGDALKRLLADSDLRIESIFAWIDFVHDDPSDCAIRTGELLDVAKAFGADNVLVLPGLLREGDNETAGLDRICDGLSEACRLAAPSGIDVTIEDFGPPGAPNGTIAGCAAILDRVPALRFAFDTGNFVCHGEDPRAAFDLFADKIITVHVKDRCPSPWVSGSEGCLCADGSVAYVAPVGSGTMPIAAVIRKLRDRGYSGNLIAELFSCGDMKQNLIRSLEYLSAQV